MTLNSLPIVENPDLHARADPAILAMARALAKAAAADDHARQKAGEK